MSLQLIRIVITQMLVLFNQNLQIVTKFLHQIQSSLLFNNNNLLASRVKILFNPQSILFQAAKFHLIQN